MEMLNAMQKFVQESIDKGATSIEDVHKRLESMPLDFWWCLKLTYKA